MCGPAAIFCPYVVVIVGLSSSCVAREGHRYAQAPYRRNFNRCYDVHVNGIPLPTRRAHVETHVAVNDQKDSRMLPTCADDGCSWGPQDADDKVVRRLLHFPNVTEIVILVLQRPKDASFVV